MPYDPTTNDYRNSATPADGRTTKHRAALREWETKRQKDKRRIAECLMKSEVSVPQAQICRQLKLPAKTVSRLIAELNEEWRNSAVMMMDVRVGQTLMELRMIKGEAWEAWEKSKQHFQSQMEEETVNGTAGSGNTATPNKKKKGKRVEDRYGDPRFLQTIMHCIQQERDILGLDAPKKIDANFRIDPLAHLSDGELDSLLVGEKGRPLDIEAKEVQGLIDASTPDPDHDN